MKAKDGTDVKSATQPSTRLTFQEFVINLKLTVLCKMCTSDDLGETLPAEDVYMQWLKTILDHRTQTSSNFQHHFKIN